MPHSTPKPTMMPEDADTIALKALGFVAGNAEYMSRFLALTGMTPEQLKERPDDPAVLGGVLDFLLQHESVLTAFAEDAELAPDQVAAARRALPGFVPWS
jgi:hypothetical protein